MSRDLLCLFLAVGLLTFSACAPEPEPEPMPEPEPAADAPAMDMDPSGTWTGDWGPNANDRNPVTLELSYDGMALTGTVNPGPNAVEIANATFDPATGDVTMEADVERPDGSTVHYTIQGTMDGDTMTGTWNHDDVTGDFTITKS